MAPPKQGTGQRKSSSSLSKTSNPSPDKTSKSSKQTKIVHLQLPKPTLLRFPHDPIAQKSIPKKKSPLSISTTAPPRDPTPPLESKSDSNDTPVPPPAVIKGENTISHEATKKEPTSPKTGSKRELGAGVEEPVKQKGKPGPKKKPRLEDGTIVHTKTTKGPAPGPNHKLGPKANQGAINAGLRALDRTGRPCKKWSKTGFNLKTFTGVIWEIPSWRAPKSENMKEDGEVLKSSASSNSQSKVDKSNSNGESEKSQPGDFVASQPPSSPAPNAATA